MSRIFNKNSEKEKRRILRTNAPNAELLVWSSLRGKAVLGYRFRRQYSVGPYVLDFYCPALKLAVEIDGDSHFQEGAQGDDSVRQTGIESLGIRFLRFTNDEVYNNLEYVLEEITRAVTEGRDHPL
jgi:very-short-patch-repair endonuclease